MKSIKSKHLVLFIFAIISFLFVGINTASAADGKKLLLTCKYPAKTMTSLTIKVFHTANDNKLSLDYSYWVAWTEQKNYDFNVNDFIEDCKFYCPNIEYYEDGFIPGFKKHYFYRNGGAPSDVEAKTLAANKTSGVGVKVPNCQEDALNDDPAGPDMPSVIKDEGNGNPSRNPDGTFNFCIDVGIIKTMSIAGIVIYVAKILVPLLLIIFGTIDFGKSVVSSDGDSIKKSSMAFVKRLIAGLIIFFIPTIVNVILSIIPMDEGKYTMNCADCLFDLNCNYVDESGYFNSAIGETKLPDTVLGG